MDIIAQIYRFVIGVDTHARKHVFAIIEAATGKIVATHDFQTTKAALLRALAWVAKQTQQAQQVLWVIEGCATYGAGLAKLVTEAGFSVVEAPRYHTAGRGGAIGKTDLLDAQRIARAALPLTVGELCHPRQANGPRAALRVLLSARDSMTTQRTANVNALTGLLRAFDLDLDARKALTSTQIQQVAGWRKRVEPLAETIARAEAVRLAKRIIELDAELKDNLKAIEQALQSTPAVGLLAQPGIGPVTAGIAYESWSHLGRVQTEAEFASLAGVNPVPASSGNTTRHRLNRGGDRQLNHALHVIAVTKMRVDPETQRYVEKRRAEGRTDREIRRCLKRYIARRIYRYLNSVAKAEAQSSQVGAQADQNPKGSENRARTQEVPSTGNRRCSLTQQSVRHGGQRPPLGTSPTHQTPNLTKPRT